MHRFPIAMVLAALLQAPPLDAQSSVPLDTGQIDSLSASLNREWRRLASLSFQAPISEISRNRLAFQHNSAREGIAIIDKLRFIAILCGESPENASLTEKLLREAGGLRRQSVTLKNIIHDEGPGTTLDKLLSALVAQADAVEGSLGTRVAVIW